MLTGILYHIILLYVRFLINFIKCRVNKVNYLCLTYHFNNIFGYFINLYQILLGELYNKSYSLGMLTFPKVKYHYHTSSWTSGDQMVVITQEKMNVYMQFYILKTDPNVIITEHPN